MMHAILFFHHKFLFYIIILLPQLNIYIYIYNFFNVAHFHSYRKCITFKDMVEEMCVMDLEELILYTPMLQLKTFMIFSH